MSDHAFKNSTVRWIDQRLPIFTIMYHSHLGLSSAEELQLLVEFRLARPVHAGDDDRHRHLPGDELHAESEPGLQFGRAHHARRELRLAAALHPPERRVVVLLRGLCPHLPRPLLRLLQGAARAAVVAGRGHLHRHDGHRVHGLCAALGPDVLLGRDRDHQPVLGHSAGRQRDHHLAVGRLRGRQPDAEPLLLAALPAAVRHRRGGRAASVGAAHHRIEQPAGHRREGPAGHPAVPSLLHDQGSVRRRRAGGDLRGTGVLRPQLCWASPTTTSRPIRW